MLDFGRSVLQDLANSINQQLKFIDPGNGDEVWQLCHSIVELVEALDSCLNTLGNLNANALEWSERFEER